MSPKPVVASEPARGSLVRQALRLEWITAGWMLIEAAVAIGSGAAAHSLSLIAFGVDSLIELASAGVLLWRLEVEMRRGEEFPERVERRASRIGAVLLFGLATYVVMRAAYGFWVRRGQEFSTPGFAVAVLAIPVMWWARQREDANCRQDRQPGAPRGCRRVDYVRLSVRHRRNRFAYPASCTELVVGRWHSVPSNRCPARQRGPGGVGSR
jgi:hypothetical protein